MFIRAYLRASTSEQDASCARDVLDAFAVVRGLRIVARYVENESGAKLHSLKLFRLLGDCEPGDVLLVEQVDRLSRLTSTDWLRLRGLIDAKQVRIVARIQHARTRVIVLDAARDELSRMIDEGVPLTRD